MNRGSLLQIFSSYAMPTPDYKHWQIKHQRKHGEEQACDGADGEGEPEDFAGAVEEEGDQAQDRGEDGQGDGLDLAGEGTEPGTGRSPIKSGMTGGVMTGCDRPSPGATGKPL